MSKRVLSFTGLSPTATADTTNLVDSTYHGLIKGASSTQRVKILEVLQTGMAPSSSSPTYQILSRDSTVATGTAGFSAGGTDAPVDASATDPSLPIVGNTFATTKPQRSATLHLMPLGINAYGGAMRWRPDDDDDFCLVGNTASLGEISLSAFTGGTTGIIQSAITYEVI